MQPDWNDTFSGFRKSVHYYKTKPTAREWLLSETRALNWQHQIYGNTQWNQGILLIHRKMFPEATNSTFHLKQNILTQLQPVQFRAASAFQNVIHSISTKHYWENTYHIINNVMERKVPDYILIFVRIELLFRKFMFCLMFSELDF